MVLTWKKGVNNNWGNKSSKVGKFLLVMASITCLKLKHFTKVSSWRIDFSHGKPIFSLNNGEELYFFLSMLNLQRVVKFLWSWHYWYGQKLKNSKISVPVAGFSHGIPILTLNNGGKFFFCFSINFSEVRMIFFWVLA